jgi:hypothetical protein
MEEIGVKIRQKQDSKTALYFGSRPNNNPCTRLPPTRGRRKPPFHAEIEAASNLPDDSPEFRAFVQDVVGVPANMAPSVAAAIRQQKWKISPNPLAAIRTAAHQEARRNPPAH